MSKTCMYLVFHYQHKTSIYPKCYPIPNVFFILSRQLNIYSDANLLWYLSTYNLEILKYKLSKRF